MGLTRREFLIGIPVAAGAAVVAGGVFLLKGERRIETEKEVRAKEIEKMKNILLGHNLKTAQNSGMLETMLSFFDSLKTVTEADYKKAVQRTDRAEYTINFDRYNLSEITKIVLASDPRDSNSTNERLVIATDLAIATDTIPAERETRLRYNLEYFFTDMEKPHLEFIGASSIDVETDDGTNMHWGSVKMRGWLESGQINVGHYYIKTKPASVSA